MITHFRHGLAGILVIMILAGCSGGGGSPTATTPTTTISQGPTITQTGNCDVAIVGSNNSVSVGCANSTSSSSKATVYLTPDTAVVDVGATITLQSIVKSTDGVINNEVTWSSSDSNKAAVSTEGKVSGIAEGTVTITVTPKVDPTISAKATVTVRPKGISPVPSFITLTAPNSAVQICSGLALSGTVTMSDGAQNKNLNWTSSNSAIGMVDPTGVVVGISAGSMTITAKSIQDPSKLASLIVQVKSDTLASAPPPTAPPIPPQITIIDSRGIVSTFAGSTFGCSDGQGTAAQFSNPEHIAVDNTGNVFVTDGYRVRKIATTGVTTTLAGNFISDYVDGTDISARFSDLRGVAVDSTGNLYVTELYRIRKITPLGVVTTVAGSGTCGFTDGTGTSAQFCQPRGLTVDNSGNVYVADTLNHRIRKITPLGVVTTVAGSGPSAGSMSSPGTIVVARGGFINGPGTIAQFEWPSSVAVDITDVFLKQGR